MFKIYLLLLLFGVSQLTVFGQVSSYSFSQSNVAYSAITGGTVHTNSPSDDDNIYNAINIGFTFKYNCVNYMQISICSNGFIAMGPSVVTSYSSLSLGSTNNIIAALSADLQGQTGSEIRSEISGTVGSQIMTIQWKDYRSYASTTDKYNFQIKLYEGTNSIEICYGVFTQDATNRTRQVGLIGSSNADFNTREVIAGTSTWATSTTGASNAVNCNLTTTTKPATGQKYTFTPTGSMNFTSATSISVAPTSIEQCAPSVPMLRVEVVTIGGCLPPPLSLTTFSVNMTGVTPTTVVSRVHVYYTGTSSTFAPTNEFVIGGLAPSAALSFSTASQSLSAGTNYFWVVYDMNNTGIVGNAIGAQMPTNPITVGGSIRSLSSSPNGTGNFIACAPYPTFSAWYKSDVNVIGSPVSTWSTNVGSYNLTQATIAKQPAVIAGSINYKLFSYNKRLNFVTTASTNLSNIGNSPDLLGTIGTVFIVSEKGTTDGTSFCYRADGTSDPRYQYKPNFRYQSGSSGYGTTIDMYWNSHPNYSTYFPSEFATNCAFINTATGANTGLSIRVNGKGTSACDYCNNSTYYPSISTGLYIGSNSGTAEFVNNDMAEIITCSTALTSSQYAKVESYLAIKFGVTIGGNTGTSSAYNYFASDGTTVFNKSTNSGYNNDIAGIGRDDGSSLNKKQSISVNTSDPVTIGLSTIAAENSANAATFSNNKSFLIWGNNGMACTSNYSTTTSNLPVGIQARIQRIWKVQATNFGGTTAGDSYKTAASPLVTIGFETSLLVAYNPISNLRLLVDDDGSNWTNATIVIGAVLNGTRIEFSNVQFSGTQKYFTLATTNYSQTMLPIELATFEAKCKNNSIVINWQTTTEINNNHFELQRSDDAINFNTISSIQGHGNSNQIQNYQYVDYNVTDDLIYYRLKQVDNNYKERYNKIIEMKNDCNTINNSNITSIYPNPSSENITLQCLIQQDEKVIVQFKDVLGRVLASQVLQLKKGKSESLLNTSDLNSGLYFIHFESEQLNNAIEKFIKE